MKNNENSLHCIFSVDTIKVKRRFLLVTAFIFFVLLGAPAMRGFIDCRPDTIGDLLADYRKIETYVVPAAFSLSVLAILWVYGKRRMFRMEWQIDESGLRILRGGHEVKHVPWGEVRIASNGLDVIDARDRKKSPVTLPPRVRHEMIAKLKAMHEQSLKNDSENR